jgi:large subunit ribosomal protein L22
MAVAEQERETVRAQARWVHSSARKARLVTDLIRGRSVPEARTILAFSNRAVAKDVDKVLRSAVANAETHPGLHWQGDDLVVIAAYADEGPTLKRWRPRARGRVARIRKRTCHITIELAQGEALSSAPSVPAMAAPEPAPVEEPEAVEESEAVDEAAVEEPEESEVEGTEEPEAEEETEEPEAEAETEEPEAEEETEEPEAEAETPEESDK